MARARLLIEVTEATAGSPRARSPPVRDHDVLIVERPLEHRLEVPLPQDALWREISVLPEDGGVCRLELRLTGRWTARWLPRPLVRLRLGWILTKIVATAAV